MKQHKRYRTVIIEPSEVIREGIKLFLETNPCFQVTASFPDLKTFEDKIIKDDFQIILINPAIINFYKPVNIRNIFAGYNKKFFIAIKYQHIDTETVKSFDGTLDIYDKGFMIPQKVLKIIEAAQPQNNQYVENIELSNREKEILVAVAKGLTNKEIADKLCISTHTVISHRKNITRKTGIKTISGLTLYALFNNLVLQDDLM